MKKVYIAGPISRGNLAENLRQALQAYAAIVRAGDAPYLPHASLFSSADVGYVGLVNRWELGAIVKHPPLPGVSEERWMGVSIEWLMSCDLLVRLPGKSAGADREVEMARQVHIPTVNWENSEYAK
jgi:Domain of unknown function (DUF4406)